MTDLFIDIWLADCVKYSEALSSERCQGRREYGEMLIWTWMKRLMLSPERKTSVWQESLPPHPTKDRHPDLSRRGRHCKGRLFSCSPTSVVPCRGHTGFALLSRSS